MARTSNRKDSNELEFQGQALNWLNEEIKRRPSLGLEKATQEKPRQGSGKRNDLVIWKDRANEIAFMALELKTPTTAINDPVLFADAVEKAQKWRAKYFAIWNMREFEVYETPPAGDSVTPGSALKHSNLCAELQSVEDWLKPHFQRLLQEQALEILDVASTHAFTDGDTGVAIDTEIFVSRLTEAIRKLRGIVYRDLAKAARSDKKLRKSLNAIAAEQGFIGFVDDIDFAIAGQIGYRYIGQILFYYALKRKIPTLKEIELQPKDTVPEALRPFWNEVRRYDYEALFGPHPLEDIVKIDPDGQFLIRQLVGQLSEYDWASLTDDVLGSIFEHLIPSGEQMLLGQFYTPRPVADLLVAFTIDGERPLVLDPGCGSGTFLMSAYSYLAYTQGLSHRELLSIIWGFDISPFAVELAVINLYRQDMAEYENFPRIVSGSYFDHTLGETVRFPAPKVKSGGTSKVDVPIPQFDCILANPPYVRSQNQDDLDAGYRRQLFKVAALADVNAPPKTDLFAFFIYQSLRFMKVGSRLGFVTSASWLTADFAATLQQTLIGKVRLVAVITSSAESFFTQVDVNAVLLIAEKVEETERKAAPEFIKFVTLKQTIATLTAGKGDYWPRVVHFVDEIEALDHSFENDRYRATLVNRQEELKALNDDITKPRNWSKYLRAPLSYYTLFDTEKFTNLANLATVSLGYKSLQNEFYYVNEATIDSFGIEKRFLKPVLKLADLSPKKFEQTATPSQWLFFCKEKDADLRGKGALRYIEAMADRAATQKKQTGKKLTIRQALTAQSGGLWYAPKAKPSEHHIWIRKGFGGVFAPFIFEDAATVDQRCNSVSPVDGISWEEIAALLTSTLFAYSAEVNGSISMGAGVLEAPTKKIRDYPIFDLRRLTTKQREELVALARSVWADEKPVDWSASAPATGSKLKALDRWLLKAAGNVVSLDQLYADLQATVKDRVNLATDKVKSTKTKRTENIGSVAAAIVSRLSPRMRSKNFPDDFIDRQLLDLPFLISQELVRRIRLTPFIDQSEILIESDGEKILLSGQYDRAVGEGIVRAILWGRSSFSIASDKSAMHKAIDDFLSWLATFEKEIEQAIADSALGTGYEAILKQEVYAQLGLSPIVLMGVLPQDIGIAPKGA